ncbi:hypothetical protein ACHAXR_006401, partial [Thalassiosira sp. AJA248-18]
IALAVSVSGNVSNDGTGHEYQSSRSFSSEDPPATDIDRSGANRDKPMRSMLRKASPSEVVAKKESHRDESIPLVTATQMDQDDRMLVKCSGDQESLRIDMTTDNYGFETSWKLEVLDGKKWTQIESGPPDVSNYADNNRYIGVYCLSPGEYKFTILDLFEDGICCTFGEGQYAGFVGGNEKFSSPTGDSKWRKRRHRFSISSSNFPPPTKMPTRMPTRQPTREPTKKPTQFPTNKPTLPLQPKTSSCTSSERKVKVEILTDKYGSDTSWMIRESQTGANVAESTKTYGPNEKEETELCLEDGGSYDFIVRDEYSDGMCCSYGEGYFKVHLEDDDGSWDEIISGGNFKLKEETQGINLKEQNMSDRDKEWLESHNTRRKEWHERYGKTYVPLKWSNGIQEESKIWADHLLSICGEGLYHDPDAKYGENLAGNHGSGSWGEVRSTDAILTRFVENEVDDEYPKNGHLTQVLWRPTKYVGCAEASKPMDGGRMCHVQVCRYGRPGNCNMDKYKKDTTDWWIEPVMLDDSPCGPECPPGGCY